MYLNSQALNMGFFYQHTTPKKTYHQNTTNTKLLYSNVTAVQLAK